MSKILPATAPAAPSHTYDPKLHANVKEAAELCNTHINSIRAWVKQGKLTPLKLTRTPLSFAQYFSRQDLADLIHDRAVTGRFSAKAPAKAPTIPRPKPQPVVRAGVKLTADTRVWSKEENQREIDAWLATHEITRCDPGPADDEALLKRPQKRGAAFMKRQEIWRSQEKWRRYRAQVFSERNAGAIVDEEPWGPAPVPKEDENESIEVADDEFELNPSIEPESDTGPDSIAEYQPSEIDRRRTRRLNSRTKQRTKSPLPRTPPRRELA